MKMSLFDEVANFQFLVLSPKGFWIGRSSINVDPDSSYLFPCNWNYRICCWCDLPLNRLTAGVVTLRPPAMPCWLTTKSLAIWQSGRVGDWNISGEKAISLAIPDGLSYFHIGKTICAPAYSISASVDVCMSHLLAEVSINVLLEGLLMTG